MEDAARLERIRAVSDALFGAKHRLPVAAAVARSTSDGLYAAQLVGEVKASDAQVGTELRHLHSAGLLVVIERDRNWARRGRQPRRYRKQESEFWELATKLAAEAATRNLPRSSM
jgi:hypothetical protein